MRPTPSRKLLFLCVSNSARSQMAEGIARSLLGPDVLVQSAGSTASAVNPLAIRVMREIGVDISGQRSKSVQAIRAEDVDTVITLCAEEVCPAFLASVRQLHWAVANPAQASGTEDERLEAFREVRDEIQRRIAALAGE
jgi:arsenate reductase